MSSDGDEYSLRARIVIETDYQPIVLGLEGVAVKEGREWMARLGVLTLNNRGVQSMEFDSRSRLLATSPVKLKKLMLAWTKQLISNEYECDITDVTLEKITWKLIPKPKGFS